MAGLDGAAAGPPAEEEAHDGYEQAARPAQDAETVAEEGAAEAAPPPEEVVFALACAGCRGEKYVLCVAGDLLEDDANKDPGALAMCLLAAGMFARVSHHALPPRPPECPSKRAPRAGAQFAR